MADDSEKSALERIVQVLHEHGVQFVLIGGQAEVLHGSSRVTYDVDFCYRRRPENLEALASALGTINPSLRDAPPDLPFRVDAETLSRGCNFTFRTDLGDLDLIGYVEPLGDYDSIVERAERFRVGDLDLAVMNLDDLITVKEHIHRPKDGEALFQLRAIRRIRDEDKGGS